MPNLFHFYSGILFLPEVFPCLNMQIAMLRTNKINLRSHICISAIRKFCTHLNRIRESDKLFLFAKIFSINLFPHN